MSFLNVAMGLLLVLSLAPLLTETLQLHRTGPDAPDPTTSQKAIP